MALKKMVSTKFGIPAEYWRVTKIEYIPKVSVHFIVQLYISKVERDAGAEPLEERSFLIREKTIPQQEIIAWCYTQAKSEAELVGATDC